MTRGTIPILPLVPVVSSGSKMKVEALCRNLEIAPRQLPNTREAINGHVVDFKISGAPDSPYWTLPKWYEAYKPKLKQFIVYCVNGKVFINVDTDGTGNSFHVRGRTIVQ